MRVNVAREHCQNDPCDLVVTCRLTNYVDLVKEEGAPEDDQPVDQFGPELKRHSRPVLHVRHPERQVREDEHPDHLLRDAEEDTERKNSDQSPEPRDGLQLFAQKAPQ